MRNEHGEDGDFICHKCSFQSNTKKRLNDHIARSHGCEALKCNNCEYIFDTKNDLMNHRKKDHANILRQCRYDQDGGCKFQADCWYKHTQTNTENETTTVTEKQSYKCNSCGKETLSKKDLMIHRKVNHIETVSKCRNYANNTCKHSADNCWFSHDGGKIEAHFDLDFQEVMEVTVPPEPKLMHWMKEIMSKMEILDKRTRQLIR